MSHNHGHECRCVSEHIPAPLDPERHHVWPLGNGGPDIMENRVWLCPTTHTNAHEILRHMGKEGLLTWGEVLAMYDERVTRAAYEVAVIGYLRIFHRRMDPPLPDWNFNRLALLEHS